MTASAVSQHDQVFWRRVWEDQRFVVLFTTLLLVLFTTPLMHALAPGAPLSRCTWRAALPGSAMWLQHLSAHPSADYYLDRNRVQRHAHLRYTESRAPTGSVITGWTGASSAGTGSLGLTWAHPQMRPRITSHATTSPGLFIIRV